MTAAVNPSRSPLLAWAGAGLVAAATAGAALAPVDAAPRLADEATTALDVALTSGLSGLLNVPVNLFNDVMNIPYDLFEAPFKVTAPAFDGAQWDSLVPQGSLSTPDGGSIDSGDVNTPGNMVSEDQSINTNPFPPDSDGITHGSLNNLADALRYTDSWWASSPTNVWGWDTGNPWNFSALINAVLPIQALSQPLADNLNTLMAAEFPIASADNKFYMHDLLGELKTIFQVPLSDLVHGYTFDDPEQTNPVGINADPLGNGGTSYDEIWSGTTKYLDPTFGLDKYFEHLTADPSGNPIHLLDLSTVYPTLVNLIHALNIDFNPFMAPGSVFAGTDSFVFQGASELYGLPYALNGIINGPNGLFPDSDFQLIPNSVTKLLGGALNEVIGPDTDLAHFLITSNTDGLNAFYGLLDGIGDILDGNFSDLDIDPTSLIPTDLGI